MFVRIFGILIDAYQHALDQATADRVRTYEAQRMESAWHKAELRCVVEQHERDQAAKAQQQQTAEPAKKPPPPKKPSQATDTSHAAAANAPHRG